MEHTLPSLKFSADALEPAISRETIEFHYGKHHQGYVNNLNSLIKGTDMEELSLEGLVMSAEGAVFNNAAQIWNHSFYFEALSPHPKKKPEGRLAEKIDKTWGSFDNMIGDLRKNAAGLFGSGWVWLIEDTDGNLSIIQESNAGNPMRRRMRPLLTIDVWEHAYYIDYRNRRPDYINAVIGLIDWSVVENRYI